MNERIIRYEQVLDNKKGEMLIWPVIKFPIVFRRKHTPQDQWPLNTQPIPQDEWDALSEVTDWCESNFALIDGVRGWAMNRTHVGLRRPEQVVLFKIRWC